MQQNNRFKIQQVYKHINYRPKRSFCQGNIFTSVCHSFCSQGGGAPNFALIFFWGGCAPNFALIFFLGGCSKFCSNFSGGPLNLGGSSKFWGGEVNGGLRGEVVNGGEVKGGLRGG